MRPFHATWAPGGQSGVTHAVGAGGACPTRRCEAFLRSPPGLPSFPFDAGAGLYWPHDGGVCLRYAGFRRFR